MTIYGFRIISAVILAVITSLQAFPYTITGRVVAGKTPVGGIAVRVTDADYRELGTASTDGNGAFAIEEVDGGEVLVSVEADGYAPLIFGVATGNADTDLGTLAIERVTDLGEVTVTARSRTDIPGKTSVYVSRTEKERAASPLNMLTLLSYKAPRIKVKESERTLTIDGEEPQILVNGIKRPMSFISSINPESIEKIEFSSEPDVRFGKRYLNIITRRPPEGGWLMADVAGAVTTPRNFFSGVADYARGRNDFMLYYSGGYRHGRREYEDEEERYIGGGKDITLGAEGIPSSTLDKWHNLYFSFTRVPSEKSMLVADATLGLHDNDRVREAHVTELSRAFDRTNRRGFSQTSPGISLYYTLQVSKTGTLELNAAGSYNGVSAYRDLEYSTGYDSEAATKSHSWHYSAEALWNQRLPFAGLVVGASYSRSDVTNRYTIDGAMTRQPLSSTLVKAYSSLSGSLLTVGYRLSAGVTYYDAEQEMWSPDVTVSLQRNFGSDASLSYYFRYNPGMPSLSDYNDVATPVNELMYHVGTDDMRREQNIYNKLQIQYGRDRFHISLQGDVSTTDHPFVTHYLYQDDHDRELYGYFLEMPGNGRRLTGYGFDLDAGFNNLWDFLSLSASAGWRHSRLEAGETHTVCSWHLDFGMGMYWRGWQLNLTASDLVPSWSMWSNTISRRWPYTSLAVYKSFKNCKLHVSWNNLFSSYGGRYRTETLSSVSPRSLDYRMNDQGNLVEIGIRYLFTTGKLLNKRQRSLKLGGNGENGVRWDY